MNLPHFNDPSLIGTVGAIAAAIAALLAHLNRGKLTDIQVNVNGRLDAALAEIARLKHEVKLLNAEKKTRPKRKK